MKHDLFLFIGNIILGIAIFILLVLAINGFIYTNYNIDIFTFITENQSLMVNILILGYFFVSLIYLLYTYYTTNMLLLE